MIGENLFGAEIYFLQECWGCVYGSLVLCCIFCHCLYGACLHIWPSGMKRSIKDGYVFVVIMREFHHKISGTVHALASTNMYVYMYACYAKWASLKIPFRPLWTWTPYIICGYRFVFGVWLYVLVCGSVYVCVCMYVCCVFVYVRLSVYMYVYVCSLSVSYCLILRMFFCVHVCMCM